MTPASIEPRAKTYQNRSPLRLVPSDELLAEAGISVRIHVPYDVEMGWTIDSTNAQRTGMNSYNIHAHIYGISRGHDHVIATDRDGVMVLPAQQSKPSTVKAVIGQSPTNCMHSVLKEEGESCYGEALESWDSPRGSGIVKPFDIHVIGLSH